jgi:tetratricopeptide (TPR) repeat protein
MAAADAILIAQQIGHTDHTLQLRNRALEGSDVEQHLPQKAGYVRQAIVVRKLLRVGLRKLKRFDKLCRRHDQVGPFDGNVDVLAHSAAREALAAFEQARAALHELPEGQERTEQLIDLCFEQRNALLLVAEFERLGKVLDEARALSERLGDQQRLGWALGYLAHLQSLLGEHPEAIEAAERACAIAKGVGDLGLSVVANYYMGLALWYAGDPSRAAESGRTAVAVLIDAPLGERLGLAVLPAVLARRLLAVALADLGEFAKGVAAGEESCELAQAAGHPYSEVLARMGLGYAHLRQGDFAAAARALEPGVGLCRTTGIRLALPIVAASLGHAYLWSGRAAEAVPLLEEAVEASTAIRMLSARSLFMTFRAEAYLVLGRIADAREQAEQAVALARAHQERGWEAWGLKLLGDVYAAEPPSARRPSCCSPAALGLPWRQCPGLDCRPHRTAQCSSALCSTTR